MKHVDRFDLGGEYQIYRTSSADDVQFYCRMGRFFADAGIRKELGGPMSDSPNHVWLVVVRGGEIVAFSGCRFNADRSVAHFTETYVLPEHRRKGLFGRLFDIKYDLCVAAGARVVKGLANAASRPTFERHGWRVASVRGQWTYYDKEVERDVIPV